MTYQIATPIKNHRLSSQSISAREFLNMREYGLDLNPSYQRGSVWTNEQRMNLVRSWLGGVPIPAVTINDRFKATRDDSNGVYAVIDGKQRIETTLAWFDGELAVPASWFDDEFIESTIETDDGPYITSKGLTRSGKALFNMYARLNVIEVAVPTIQEEAELYVMLEQSGTPQTAEDVANAQRIAEGN